jgi:hypothetical protein
MQTGNQNSTGRLLVRHGWDNQIAVVEVAPEVELENSLPKRGERVAIECGRGIEVGECLGPCSVQEEIANGKLIRKMSIEDELLDGHLRELANRALNRCLDWLNEFAPDQVLLEVEPLLDGRTLFFYFLNDPDDCVQEHLDRLVTLYDQEVRNSEFAQKVEAGCGPGCGTSSAKSGCSNCSSCSVGCRVKKTTSHS